MVQVFLPRYVENPLKNKLQEEELTNYLYADYSNLNIELIRDYNLSLDIFPTKFLRLITL